MKNIEICSLQDTLYHLATNNGFDFDTITAEDHIIFEINSQHTDITVNIDYDTESATISFATDTNTGSRIQYSNEDIIEAVTRYM